MCARPFPKVVSFPSQITTLWEGNQFSELWGDLSKVHWPNPEHASQVACCPTIWQRGTHCYLFSISKVSSVLKDISVIIASSWSGAQMVLLTKRQSPDIMASLFKISIIRHQPVPYSSFFLMTGWVNSSCWGSDREYSSLKAICSLVINARFCPDGAKQTHILCQSVSGHCHKYWKRKINIRKKTLFHRLRDFEKRCFPVLVLLVSFFLGL